MKIYVTDGLPAIQALADEGISLSPVQAEMDAPGDVARVAFINLMPEKIPAERDVLRLLCAGGVEVDGLTALAVSLFRPAAHECRHTDAAHLARFYSCLHPSDVSSFAAVVINGAPLERVAYRDVDYSDELAAVCDAAAQADIPVLYLCWGAFFGLYRQCGVDKTLLASKLSGVYPHRVVSEHPVTRGLPSTVYLPHSRHCVLDGDIATMSDRVKVLVSSDCGPGNVVSVACDKPEMYITAHPEYDTSTLAAEYSRDCARGLNPHIPENYFPDDDPSLEPRNLWAAPAARLMANWFGCYVAPRFRDRIKI